MMWMWARAAWWGRLSAAIVLGAAVGLAAVPVAEAQGKAGTSATTADVDAAMRLHKKAVALYQAGKYDEAVPLAEHVLAIREKALGPEHLEVATALNDLAALCAAKGQYGRAEPLYERALAIREKALGPDHPDVADSLHNLALLLVSKGQAGRAEPLYERALAIRERALGHDHPDVARSLNNLAGLYVGRDEYGRAKPLYERALAIREKALGPDHRDVAESLNNLGMLHFSRGDHGRAEPLYLRALAIWEKALGAEHPDVANFVNNLAELYSSRGEYRSAEPLLQRALAVREKALGPEHPLVAAALNNLAQLYEKKGEYDRAEPLYERALAVRERALGPDHPDVAASLNNLAVLYRVRKRQDGRAEALLLRALAIREKALGPEHPDVAQTLDNLAALYDGSGQYDRAAPLHQRALAIFEKVLGPDHLDVAITCNNLAVLYQSKGEYARAEPLYQRALAIQERVLGLEHPDLANSLSNHAALFWASGRQPEAIRALIRGQDVREKMLDLLLASGSEAQKRAFLAPFRGESYVAATLALDTHDPLAAGLASLALLRRKGRALDAMAGSYSALRARLGPEEQKLFDELQAVRSQDVALTLRGPTATSRGTYRHDREALNERIRQLEYAISARSEVFRIEEQPITVGAVQAALPDDAALVEWAAYAPFNPRLGVGTERWGAPRYAASILPKHGNPSWLDLGDAESIDADIKALRDAFAFPATRDIPTLARALEARVMAPVRARLGETRRIFLSPDGQLNLIPFAALTSEDGRPLIERYAFTYLTSGRDLLRRAARTSAREAPLVVTSPAFDLDAPGGSPFAPLLRGTEVSASIAAHFPHPAPTLLTGRDATKARLQQVHGPQFLHLGSHGYFDDSGCTTASPEALRNNPLLRSGIALAGANACTSGHDDGLLTASEASALDLYGTRLAVLSACQSGNGEVKAGDGVYGLRRALVLAGAETQVMSLWKVDEAATAELMQAYYEGLARGEGRSEAMRRVQLAMLHDGRHEHPYYWAAFIVSGDDRSLDGMAAVPDLGVHPGGACACRMGEQRPDGDVAWLAAVALGVVVLARRRRGWKLGAALVLVAAVWLGGAPAAEAQGDDGPPPGAAEVEEGWRLNEQALALLRAGKYDEGIPVAERALAVTEKALGRRHPNVAASLNNLATLYRAKGEYARAEPILQRALAIFERAPAPNLLKVGVALNNLAALYTDMGEYAHAEPLFQRALTISQETLGPDHPRVASDLRHPLK
jgi:MYXO-CTERM domain-containing protein